MSMPFGAIEKIPSGTCEFNLYKSDMSDCNIEDNISLVFLSPIIYTPRFSHIKSIK